MLAVAIHAHSLYKQPVPSRKDASKGGLLATLSTAVLSDRRYFYRGFAVYCAASTLVYCILAVSSGILVVSLDVIGRTDLAGAISGGVEFNVLIPLAASTLFISASQIPPVSRVENALRGIAHSLAGVPNTVFVVQEKIADQLESLCNEQSEGRKNPLSTVYTENLDLEARILELADRSREVPASALAGHPGLGKTLWKIECLYGWTLGSSSDQMWIGKRSEEILTLIDDDTHQESYTALTLLVDSSTADGVSKDWTEIATRAEKLEARLIRLLALLLMNKPEARLGRFPRLAIIRSFSLSRSSEPAHDSHAKALLIGTALVLFALFAYQFMQQIAQGQIRTNSDLISLSPLNPVIAEDVSLTRRLIWEMNGSDGLSASTREQIEDSVVSFVKRAGFYLSEALWGTLNQLLVFGLSATVALIAMRTNGMGTQPSVVKGYNQQGASTALPSALSWIGIGIVAYVVCMPAVIIVNFAKLVIPVWTETQYPIFSSINIDGFSKEVPRLLLYPLFSFAFAAFVCFLYRQQAKTLGNSSVTGNSTLWQSVRVEQTSALPAASALNRQANGSTTFATLFLSGLFVFLFVAGYHFLLSYLPGVASSPTPSTVDSSFASALPYFHLLLPILVYLSLTWLFLYTMFRASNVSWFAIRTALLVGGLIAFANLGFRAVIGSVPSGWSVMDAVTEPFMGFTLLTLAYIVYGPFSTPSREWVITRRTGYERRESERRKTDRRAALNADDVASDQAAFTTENIRGRDERRQSERRTAERRNEGDRRTTTEPAGATT